MAASTCQNRPIVLVGQGRIAHCVYDELKSQGRTVVALAAHRAHMISQPSWALPIPAVAVQELPHKFDPARHDVFVAVGYQNRNHLRRALRDEIAEMGFGLTNIVPPEVDRFLAPGASNVLVLRGAQIQSGALIGSNSFVWSGAIVGHHSVIDDDCWVASGAILGGEVSIGPACFIGLAAIVAHSVKIGSESIVGAGALVTGDLEAESVTIGNQSKRHRLKSSHYAQLFAWI